MKFINCDILKFECDYIVHQCNCISKGSKGLAKRIFDTFPETNIYKNRNKPDIPGTISITKLELNLLNSSPNFKVINLFAQYYPGKSNRTNDSEDLRLKWFHKGLFEISKLEPKTIAFPNGIGCRLAQGKCSKILNLINNFDCYTQKMYNTQVFICNYDLI